MKKFKKVLAAVLAMAMVLGMSVTSMAAGNVGADGKMGTKDDTGMITVENINYDSKKTEPTVTAYKIIEATYDTNGVFTGYNLVYDKSVADIDLSANPVKVTEANLSALANHIAKNNVQGEPMTLTGNKATATVGVGSYLVMIQGSDTMIYSPVVVSLYYENDGTGNDLNEGNLTIANVDGWVKVTDAPTVKKVIEETASPSNATSSDVKGNSANIGDTVSFKLPVSPIPNYTGEHPRFDIVDTLSTGLTYNMSSLKVTVDGKQLTDGKDYTFDPSGQVLTINFVVNGAYTLNNYAGKDLEIKYTATLNENAAINNPGNENDVVLNYTKDSTVIGQDATSSDATYTYTFDIDGKGTVTENIITKRDGAATSSNALRNAKFTLYTEDPEKNTDAAVYDKNPKLPNGVVTSDEDGLLTITGLEAGTYYLKETEAPSGYTLNTHVFKIEITANIDAEGKLTSWGIKIDGTETSHFTVNNGVVTPSVEEVVIPNTKLSSLPSTGGIGTTIFTLGGCAIMIIAAGLYFASRRKKTEK